MFSFFWLVVLGCVAVALAVPVASCVALASWHEDQRWRWRPVPPPAGPYEPPYHDDGA